MKKLVMFIYVTVKCCREFPLKMIPTSFPVNGIIAVRDVHILHSHIKKS